MTDTTANYALKLPELGEDEDVWALFTNQNWEQVDALIFALREDVDSLSGQTVFRSSNLTGTTNNFNESGSEDADIIVFNAAAGAFTVTGLANGAAGRTVRLFNGSTFEATFSGESGSSLDVNRFESGFTLQPKESLDVFYDDVANRWRGAVVAIPLDDVDGDVLITTPGKYLGFELNATDQGHAKFRATNGLGDTSIILELRVQSPDQLVDSQPVTVTLANGASVPTIGLNALVFINALVTYISNDLSGSGAPRALTRQESGLTLTNTGAVAKCYYQLPSAEAGLSFTIVNMDTDGVRLVASTGDVIRVANVASTAGGYVETTTVGNSITVRAIDTTNWIATSQVGTAWTGA